MLFWAIMIVLAIVGIFFNWAQVFMAGISAVMCLTYAREWYKETHN